MRTWKLLFVFGAGVCLFFPGHRLAAQVIVLSEEAPQGKPAAAAIRELRENAEKIEGIRILPQPAKDQVLYELGQMPAEKREAYLKDLGEVSLDEQKMKIHILIQSALDKINKEPTPDARTAAWNEYQKKIRTFLGDEAARPKTLGLKAAPRVKAAAGAKALAAGPGDLAKRLEAIEARLSRMDEKLDRLLGKPGEPGGKRKAMILTPARPKNAKDGEKGTTIELEIEAVPEEPLPPGAKPIEKKGEMAKTLILRAIEAPSPERGKGFLGVAVAPMDADAAAERRLPAGRGVRVDVALSDSPASRAGLASGDVILAFAGKIIESPEQLSREVASRNPGEEVEILVVRAGAERRIDAIRVKLGSK